LTSTQIPKLHLKKYYFGVIVPNFYENKFSEKSIVRFREANFYTLIRVFSSLLEMAEKYFQVVLWFIGVITSSTGFLKSSKSLEKIAHQSYFLKKVRLSKLKYATRPNTLSRVAV